jgi:predicted regulator of Ras-like GTPase activity (Roadblock/LC7/MglB family)
MTELTRFASLPDVKSAVLGDLAGSFLDSLREPDGESVAAVMGFVCSTLAHVGAELGLGALRRVSVTSDVRACVVLVTGDSVVTACIEPARSLAAFEKALDHAASLKV